MRPSSKVNGLVSFVEEILDSVEFRLWHGYCLLFLFRFVMREERHEHCAIERERGLGKLKVTDKDGANRGPAIVEEIGTIKEKLQVLCWTMEKTSKGKTPPWKD